MKVAFHNAFFGKAVAETEISRRLTVAASRLGWEAKEVGTSAEIDAWRPDFVVALHFFTPKLTRFPTYGCMWNPPGFMESNQDHLRAVLSYDAYLTSGDTITEWVRDLSYGFEKQTFFAPFYASCLDGAWRAPLLEAPRLVYLGTNWDGERHPQLFQDLSERPFFDVYGPAGRWPSAAVAYRGPLPFDGATVTDVLNRSGVGLCFHRAEHREAGIPNARIFEIVSSGALAICEEHPFVRQTFGDSVLYLPAAADADATCASIDDQMAWIRSHRAEALEMSRRAHAIFSRSFSLEKLLENVGREHERLTESKGSSEDHPPQTQGHVQVVIRTAGRSSRMLSRALKSISAQTYRDVSVLIVRRGTPDIAEALASCPSHLEVEMVDLPAAASRSESLWAGLKAAKAVYVANLDDDDEWFPNHLATLVPLVAPGRRTAVAYSGAVRQFEQDDRSAPPPPSEPATLLYHHPFDRDRLLTLDNYITSNAWIARRELIDGIGDDPRLLVLEDLALLLRFAEATDFAFSGEVTVRFFERTSATDNTRHLPPSVWEQARERIRRMLWKSGLVRPQKSSPAQTGS